MENVSKDFKNAIKSTEREVKGYVEVVYSPYSASDMLNVFEEPQKLFISTEDAIVNGVRKNKNYATLEKNFTLLDGSFVLPNANLKNEDAGYISEDFFGDIEKCQFIVLGDVNKTKSAGLTIYFDSNIAQIFNITITDDEPDNNPNTYTFNIKNNTHEIYQLIFDEPIAIYELTLDILQVEYPGRRVRIPEIDFGISYVYEDGDLVSYTTNEEIDLLLTSTPTSTCTVNLNNYDKIFDPLNPKGITNFLTDNSVIRPYCGILTENNAVEYLNLGTYYLNDWSSEPDGSVTLNGNNIMGKLTNLELVSDGNLFKKDGFTGNELSAWLTKIYGYDFSLKTELVKNRYLKETGLLKYIQTLCLYSTNINNPKLFSIKRNETISFDDLIREPVDSITRTELQEEAKFTTQTVVKEVKITNYDLTDGAPSSLENILNTTFTLTKEEQYVWFTFNKRCPSGDPAKLFSYTVVSGNPTAELIDNNTWMAYIKFTGNPGDQVTVIYRNFGYDPRQTYELDFKNNKQAGDTISIDYTNYFSADRNNLEENAQFYLSFGQNYSVSLKYNGDPSYLVGDAITVETVFGNKDMIITKHSLTFDGGLSGTIEGIGE